MNLIELEKCYLSCLLNGAAVQDIVLKTDYLETMHQEIKRLKSKGLIQIPVKIIEGAKDFDYDVKREHVDFYVSEILEEHRKRDLRKTAEKIKNCVNPSDDQISDLRAELDRIAEKTCKMDIITSEQLRNKDFKNTEFIVEKLIPVGLIILMGSPKKGKSWLLLLLIDAICRGISIFNYKAKKVPVLYFSLEDNFRRCKYRLGKLKDPNTPWSDNFFLCEKVKGNIGIVNGIKKTGARVIIVDTYGAFKPDIKDSNNYYETTKAIRELKEIAETFQVAILVVCHTRKSKESSSDWTSEIVGSQGWIGAADTIIYLDRKKDSLKAQLKITGRDISDSFLDIIFNDGYWQIDHETTEKRLGKK